MDNNEPRQTREATWRAFNGHIVEGIQYRWGTGEWRTEGFSAVHSDTCSCEDGYMEDN